MSEANSQDIVDVTAEQLPMHCPAPDAPLWNSHPRVYIPLREAGSAACPYCGTRYRLVDAAGQPVAGTQPDASGTAGSDAAA